MGEMRFSWATMGVAKHFSWVRACFTPAAPFRPTSFSWTPDWKPSPPGSTRLGPFALTFLCLQKLAASHGLPHHLFVRRYLFLAAALFLTALGSIPAKADPAFRVLVF